MDGFNVLYEVLANNEQGSYSVLVMLIVGCFVVVGSVILSTEYIYRLFCWVNDKFVSGRWIANTKLHMWKVGIFIISNLTLCIIFYWHPHLLWGIVIAIGLTASAFTVRMILRKLKNKQN